MQMTGIRKVQTRPPPTVEEAVKTAADGNIRLRTIAATMNRGESVVSPIVRKAQKAGLIKYSEEPGWQVAPRSPDGRW